MAIDITNGSGKKVWWKGKCGHEWQASINHRVNGRNCPYCSGKRVLAGFNDIVTINPKLASEWHPTKNAPILVTELTSGSNKKVWWQCEYGHDWQATVNSRSQGNGCPICYKENRRKNNE